MQKEIYINATHRDHTRIAVVENRKLVDLFIDRKEGSGIVGNIYKAKVKNILPGMEAAFLDIGLGRDVFLPLSEPFIDILVEADFMGKIKKAIGKILNLPRGLKRGQDILVQVGKEAIGKKGARVTTWISLAGRNLVFMPTVDHIGISKRIMSRKEKHRLRELLRKVKVKGQGFIVRTVGEGISEAELIREANYLMELWRNIKMEANKVAGPACVYEELDVVGRVLRDSFTETDKIVVDSEQEHNKIWKFLSLWYPLHDRNRQHLKNRVKLHQGPQPMFQVYGLEAQINKAVQRKVDLPSGGHLVIDEAEALTAIDINTGKFKGTRSLEETVFVTNVEAAQEIAHQVRLRSIGGIIIIDFIAMDMKKHQEKVMNTLEEAFREDKAKINIVPLTELGLVEMTRHRIRPSLSKILCVRCAHCGGTGLIPRKD
ncbi:MAG: Rne/Rng family ribonuclease [bacterium]